MSGPPAKLALITGGCRRLGAAIAERLAQEGYALALHASENCAPEPTLAATITRNEIAWATFAADLADEQAVEALVPAVSAHFGRVPELLVNNASRFDWDTPDSASPAGLLGHYAVNAVAPAVLTRAIAAAADAERPATVVNILDQRVVEPNADQFSYTMSKLALSEMTSVLARHYAPAVRVVAVAPGLTIPTEDYDAVRMERLAGKMPLHRLPTPHEVAAAVIYLVNAHAVTGQTIFVDGGAHLRRFERDFLFLGDRES